MPEIWFPHLGIKINELRNVAFSIFGLNVYWYGIIIGSGVIISLLLATHEAERTGQSKDTYIDFTIVSIITCIIGARFYYVIFSWQLYKDNIIDIFALRNGGLAIYGAIIAGIITAIIYTKKKNINFWLFADTAAPSLLLGQIIGRWGNFVNREAFGGYTDSLFAMRYLKDTVSNIPSSVLDKVVSVNGFDYIQVHPTFLYESVWNLCLFIFLMVFKKNKKFDGQIFSIYAIGYGIGRFWIEGLRTDQLIIWNTGVAISQVISIILIIAAMYIYYSRKNASGLNIKKD